MKSFYFLLIIMIISCNKEEVKKQFIVSEFNRNLEKHFEESKKKNPEILTINEIQLYNYSKGKFNFIFAKNDKIYYYQEHIIDGFCGTKLVPEAKIKRTLPKDSLHIINYNEIKSILKASKNKQAFMDNWKQMLPILFIFENDTIPNYDIQKLLTDVDSLGYHRYDVRRIAPFEKSALE